MFGDPLSWLVGAGLVDGYFEVVLRTLRRHLKAQGSGVVSEGRRSLGKRLQVLVTPTP